MTPGTTAVGSCLQALREGTRAHHDAIEQVMDAQRLGEPGYHRRVMQAFLDFHAAWEPELAEALKAESADNRDFLASGSRWPQLQADAEALSLSTHPVVPVAGSTLQPEQLWGAAYVLWGSMLGGRVICRQHDHATLDDGAPAPGWAYFHGLGERTGAMWKGFVERLQGRAGQPGWSDALAVQAAQDTFSRLTQAMQAIHALQPVTPATSCSPTR
jgi:heme oxygenase